MAFDRQIGAITVYCEASGEPTEAKLGVAFTLVNRLAEGGRYGKTLAEVCLRRCQFSEWNDDTVNNHNLLRAARVSERDPVMIECLSVLDEAMSGQWPDTTDGATHYHDDTVLQPPSWVKGATECKRLGAFVFYKDVK